MDLWQICRVSAQAPQIGDALESPGLADQRDEQWEAQGEFPDRAFDVVGDGPAEPSFDQRSALGAGQWCEFMSIEVGVLPESRERHGSRRQVGDGDREVHPSADRHGVQQTECGHVEILCVVDDQGCSSRAARGGQPALGHPNHVLALLGAVVGQQVGGRTERDLAERRRAVHPMHRHAEFQGAKGDRVEQRRLPRAVWAGERDAVGAPEQHSVSNPELGVSTQQRRDHGRRPYGLERTAPVGGHIDRQPAAQSTSKVPVTGCGSSPTPPWNAYDSFRSTKVAVPVTRSPSTVNVST